MKKITIICTILFLLTGCNLFKNEEKSNTNLQDKGTVEGYVYSSGITISNILPDEYSSLEFSDSNIIIDLYETSDEQFNSYSSKIFNEIKNVADDGKVYDDNNNLLSSFNQKMIYYYNKQKVNFELYKDSYRYVIDIVY